MKLSTSEIYRRALDEVLNQQSKLSTLQNNLSTQKKINRPSDDPVGATRVLTINQGILRNEQYNRNIDFAKGTLQLEEASLEGYTNALQRLRELTVTAGSGTLSHSDRQGIAQEMNQRLEELVSIANTRDLSGNFLFAGFANTKPPVTQSGTGDYTYNGSLEGRQIHISETSQIATADQGHTLFFDIADAGFILSGQLGRVHSELASTGLVNSGTLTGLAETDVILNHVPVTASLSDGYSSTDAASSAIAIANAINTEADEHQVVATAASNTLNLGVFTAGILAAGDLSINGQSIVIGGASEENLLNQINEFSETTGVTASLSAGPGSDVILTAADGRNIQLAGDGGSAATFANLDLNAGAAFDQVQRAQVILQSANEILVGGGSPTSVGLAAGTLGFSVNTGTGTLAELTPIGTPSNPDQDFQVRFNGDGSYSVYSLDEPLTPLEGFDALAYEAGAPIEIDGRRFQITGNPQPGDSFTLSTQANGNQSVFSSLYQLINGIRQYDSQDPRLQYTIATGLANIDSAETRLLETRASVGVRLNVLDSQQSINTDVNLVSKEKLSGLEDLDLSKAISEFKAMEISLQAAQQSFVRIQSLSIFNYLR